MKRIIAILLMLISISICYGKDSEDAGATDQEQPPQEGNFIFPYPTQQPGSLIAFGENIINQGQLQLLFFGDDDIGPHKRNADLIPSILYGITDNLSVLFSLPIAADFKNQQMQSSGLEDSILQFEYAFYAKSTRNYIDQATLVANMTFPTGSTSKQPPTGVGSPSFFLGATLNRTYVKWLMFTSYGTIQTTIKDATKFGNSYLYQAGVGRNLFDIDHAWLFALILEADGTYTEKNKINGQVDPNSGGNDIFVTPSLWASTQHLVLQFGAGFPIAQALNGNQIKTSYLLAFNMAWAF